MNMVKIGEDCCFWNNFIIHSFLIENSKLEIKSDYSIYLLIESWRQYLFRSVYPSFESLFFYYKNLFEYE